MERQQAIARRIHAQQLDRPAAPRPVTDTVVLDLGVQDTGRDGASWALVNRGVPLGSAGALEADPALALAWTLRSSPHYYRRADLPDVAVATSPFSDRDAAKRVLGAGKPLVEAGIPTRQALAEVAARLRDVVSEPLGKGEVSTQVSRLLDAPYLRDCVPCGARHVWESTFRIAALYGGLELTPGTSPPVLRPIPDWPQREAGPAEDPLAVPQRLQVVRACLRLLGPTTPQEVATFLDGALADVKAHWPEEATPVEVDGRQAWSLPDDDEGEAPPDLVRLLGPFDLLLQGRDRKVLLPDIRRHKALWPTIGRPGAVLVGTELVGTWRPRAAGRRLTLRLDLWSALSARAREGVGQEAERLAAHRGVELAGLEEA